MTRKVIALTLLYLCHSLALHSAEDASSFDPAAIIKNLSIEQHVLDWSLYNQMNKQDQIQYLLKWNSVQMELFSKVLNQLSTSITKENVNADVPDILDEHILSNLFSNLHAQTGIGPRDNRFKYSEYDYNTISFESHCRLKPLEFALCIVSCIELYWDIYLHEFKDQLLEQPECNQSCLNFEQNYSNNKQKIKDFISNILSMGCDPSICTKANPVLVALELEYDNGYIAQQLLQHNADLILQDTINSNPSLIILAAAKTLKGESVALFKDILDTISPLSPNYLHYLHSALWTAIDPEIADLLIKKGAKIDVALDTEKKFPMKRLLCLTWLPVEQNVGLKKLLQQKSMTSQSLQSTERIDHPLQIDGPHVDRTTTL